jgi:5-(carboxyamino)imidazole ribonucleotide mutase/phosphoribosylaminoimidazole-succinocarboxamide synthase
MAKRVIVIMGSKADRATGEAIKATLHQFGVPCTLRIASAHKSPGHLLTMLEEYEASGEVGAYITVAGRSNALSGLVDAQVAAPVIACPPLAEPFAAQDVFSSLRMPSGVCPAVVLEPANAALLAVKVLAVADPALRQAVQEHQTRLREGVVEDDEALQRERRP